SDDRRRHAIKSDRLSQDLRVTSKTTLPEAIADDRNRCYIADLIFFIRERSTHRGLDSEDIEQGRRETLSKDALRLRTVPFGAKTTNPAAAPVERAERLERTAVTPQHKICRYA